MRFSTLVLVGLQAALAASQASVPPDIQSVILTAIPPASLSELTDPAKATSVANDIYNGKYPNWYASLPPSVKSYFSLEEPTARRTGVSTLQTRVSSSRTSSGGAVITVTGTPEPDSTPRRRKSQGWIAAAVVVPLVFLIALGLGLFFILRHRKNNKAQIESQNQNQSQIPPNAPVSAYTANAGDPVKEGPPGVSEMPVAPDAQGHLAPYQQYQQTGQYQYPQQQYPQQYPQQQYPPQQYQTHSMYSDTTQSVPVSAAPVSPSPMPSEMDTKLPSEMESQLPSEMEAKPISPK